MSEIPIEINITAGLLIIGISHILNGVLAMTETALLPARQLFSHHRTTQDQASSSQAGSSGVL
jgi:hypothetical protein